MKKTPSTKIELNANKTARTRDLDELAQLLFPGNRNHQKIFLAIFVELKYADSQYLPTLGHLCSKHNFSPRSLETVRSKMRRMGLIDHVSRFNKKYGYREGWVFSSRFHKTLKKFSEMCREFKTRSGKLQQQKDRNLLQYL